MTRTVINVTASNRGKNINVGPSCGIVVIECFRHLRETKQAKKNYINFPTK